jgi:hypothetical protein
VGRFWVQGGVALGDGGKRVLGGSGPFRGGTARLAWSKVKNNQPLATSTPCSLAPLRISLQNSRIHHRNIHHQPTIQPRVFTKVGEIVSCLHEEDAAVCAAGEVGRGRRVGGGGRWEVGGVE